VLEFAHALLQINEGLVGMCEDRLDALKKRNEISFRCHRRSKTVGRGREGDSLGAIRFQRNVRRTVGQDLSICNVSSECNLERLSLGDSAAPASAARPTRQHGSNPRP
jgi:hypothetical protein